VAASNSAIPASAISNPRLLAAAIRTYPASVFFSAL
jgi:hypothetical protein